MPSCPFIALSFFLSLIQYPRRLDPPTSISDRRFADLVNNQRRCGYNEDHPEVLTKSSSWNICRLHSLAGDLWSQRRQPGWKCNSDALFPSIPEPIPSLIPSILWTSEPKLHVFLTQSLMGEEGRHSVKYRPMRGQYLRLTANQRTGQGWQQTGDDRVMGVTWPVTLD